MPTTLTIRPTDNIANLGREIAAGFLARVGDLRLDAAEAALVDRASHRIAAAAILSPGAPPEVASRLKLDRDTSVAVMANLLAAKAVDAEQVLRQTAYDVLDRVIRIGIGLAVAALA